MLWSGSRCIVGMLYFLYLLVVVLLGCVRLTLHHRQFLLSLMESKSVLVGLPLALSQIKLDLGAVGFQC